MGSALKRRAPQVAYIVSIALLTLIIIADSFLTKHVSESAKQEILERADSDIEVLGSYLDVEMEIAQRAVGTMAKSPWILPALVGGSREEIANADSVLDRYNESMGTSVCYLLDTKGTTIASSNRALPSSFVGENYSFRPYFEQARDGKRGHYFALGVTSHKRGYYVSFPVRAANGDIRGVVVVKKELDSLEEDMKHFKQCFFISPEGVLFLSSRKDLLFKSVFPISADREKELIKDKQFGVKPFAYLFPEKVSTGDFVKLEGHRYIVTRRETSEEGWTLIILSSAWPILRQEIFAIMSAVFLVLLILGFMFFVYKTERSYQLLTQSEERFHRLANSALEGIMLHKGGKVQDANERLAKMTGYTLEELIGSDVLSLVAPDYRELVRTKIQTGDNNPYEISGVRKDGSIFNAEVSGADLETGEHKLRVVSVKDITERKRSEARISRINDILINLGTDFDTNIHQILRACGETLDADFAMYNRVESKGLCTVACWNMEMPDTGPVSAEGHICFDVILEAKKSKGVREIRDLQNTKYYDTDGVVKELGLQTYVGYPIYFFSECVGTMCLLFQRDFILDKGDARFLSILGEAIAREEARRSAELGLRASEIRYKTLYNSSRDAIMILDPEDGFVNGNNATLELFGCGSEYEFTQQTPNSLSPEYQPDGELSAVKAKKMISVALNEGVNFFEWQHKKNHGEEFAATVLLTKMELGGKVLIQATVRDISDSKEAERQLKQQKDLLNKKNKDLLLKIQQVETAMGHIKKLEGLVPICASCKKIRLEDKDGKDPKSWISLEKYISDNTDAALTHGLCPDCIERLYGRHLRKEGEE